MDGRHPTVRSAVAGLAGLAAIAAACQDQPAPTAMAERALGPSAHLTVYEANLQPLNAEWTDKAVTGKAIVTLNANDGSVTVEIEARGLQPGMIHPQHIHGTVSGAVGTCPKPSADVNGDKVLDVIEGLPDYGPILLSLDGDLSNGPAMDVASFPNPTDRFGRIDYQGSGSVAAINAAIAAELGAGAMLGPLENRHIVIHGVASDTDLPSTTASLGTIPAFLTLPVACGELRPAN